MNIDLEAIEDRSSASCIWTVFLYHHYLKMYRIFTVCNINIYLMIVLNQVQQICKKLIRKGANTFAQHFMQRVALNTL